MSAMRDEAAAMDEPDLPEGHCRWEDFARAEPELAGSVRARLEAHRHHVLATLRADGSPRVSGTEVAFVDDDLTIGSMWMAMKVLDIRRDGRFELHSNPGEASMEGGDAKVRGVAVELTGDRHARYTEDLRPPTPFHLIRLDLGGVAHTSLHPAGDHLVIRTWKPGSAVSTVER
jgi:hypothetical protein